MCLHLLLYYFSVIIACTFNCILSFSFLSFVPFFLFSAKYKGYRPNVIAKAKIDYENEKVPSPNRKLTGILRPEFQAQEAQGKSIAVKWVTVGDVGVGKVQYNTTATHHNTKNNKIQHSTTQHNTLDVTKRIGPQIVTGKAF